MSMTISADLSGLNDLLSDLGERVELAARPAAQAGAQVLYDAVQRNVASIGRVTGNLASSIYQAYSRDHSGPGRATYHVSWNARRARHGHLVEYGYTQRYATYIGSDGRWHTAVRPEMRGKPRPPRSANQAVKDAYYVPLDQARQVAAKPFIRPAAALFDQAAAAATEVLLRTLA